MPNPFNFMHFNTVKILILWMAKAFNSIKLLVIYSHFLVSFRLFLYFLCILSVLSTIKYLFLFIQVLHSEIVTTFQSFSIIFYIVEICMNFLTIKSASGKKLTTLKDIFSYYIHDSFSIDILSVCLLVLDISLDVWFTSYLRLIIILKLPKCL